MSEKITAIPAADGVPPVKEEITPQKPAKTAAKKSEKAATRRTRPPLSPELYVELGSKQYNITDLVERAKADYRTTHKVGVQSCKIYVKPEEGAAYYVINKVTGKLDL